MTTHERSQLTQAANNDVDTLLNGFRHRAAEHVAALPQAEQADALDRLHDLVSGGEPVDDDLTRMFAEVRARIAARIGALPEKNAWFVQEHLTRFINHGYEEAIRDQKLLNLARQRAPGLNFDGVGWSTNPATFEPVMVLHSEGRAIGTLHERRVVLDNPLRVETRYEVIE